MVLTSFATPGRAPLAQLPRNPTNQPMESSASCMPMSLTKYDSSINDEIFLPSSLVALRWSWVKEPALAVDFLWHSCSHPGSSELTGTADKGAMGASGAGSRAGLDKKDCCFFFGSRTDTAPAAHVLLAKIGCQTGGCIGLPLIPSPLPPEKTGCCECSSGNSRIYSGGGLARGGEFFN
jgi:hypothetical protein